MTERPGQGSVRSKMTRESTRVDSHDCGNSMLAQESLEGPGRAPVGRNRREVANHNAAAPGVRRLVVEGRHAVVAYVRIGEGDDLARVARVGDDLLITAERGVEDELSCGEPLCWQVAGGVTLEGRPVSQHQHRGNARHASAPSFTTSKPFAIVARTLPTNSRPS